MAKADILWRDTAGDVGIWLMNGTAILQSAVVGNVSTSWVIAGADMYGDIFWRNSTTGEVGMWVMAGISVAQTVDFGVGAADLDNRRHWRFRRQWIDRYSLARYERQCRRLAAERH